MQYDDLVRTVLNSQPKDWQDIGHPVWPQYLSYGTVRRDGELSDWISVREHSQGWVLRSNVQIQLAFGLESGDELSFDWPPLPDPKVIGRHVEIKFNGQPVFRDMLISVDGRRCVLPLPASETINDEEGMPSIRYAYSATKDEIALARLVDSLTGGDRFDVYMRLATILGG
jgi:hypothetical protein